MHWITCLLAVLVSLCLTPCDAHALGPNPIKTEGSPFDTNYGTIEIENDRGNRITFHNYGTIQINAPYEEISWIGFIPIPHDETPYLNNWAVLNNYGFLNNYSLLINEKNQEYGTGTLNNYGTLNNANVAILFNSAPATLNNSGVLNNIVLSHIFNTGTLNNSGILNNSDFAFLHNSGTLANTGTLNNEFFATLDNDASLTNSGTLKNTLATLNNNAQGTLVNAAGGTIDNAGVLNNFGIMVNSNGATVNNSRTLNNKSGGILFNLGQGILNNSGILNNESGAGLDNFGVLNNSGTVNNSGTIAGSGTYAQTGGQTINNGIMSQAMTLIQAGSLIGGGTINGPVTLGEAATLSPGNSPGTMTINGLFTSAGTLLFEIAGLAPGTFDVLDINGNAVFTGGTLQFDFSNGYEAKIGDYWDFLLAESITGWDTLAFDFNGLGQGLGWEFAQIEGGERLLITETSQVPVPAAVWLLGSGLLGLVGFRRKFSH